MNNEIKDSKELSKYLYEKFISFENIENLKFTSITIGLSTFILTLIKNIKYDNKEELVDEFCRVLQIGKDSVN